MRSTESCGKTGYEIETDRQTDRQTGRDRERLIKRDRHTATGQTDREIRVRGGGGREGSKKTEWEGEGWREEKKNKARRDREE